MKALKIVGVIVVLLGLIIINGFIYPFTTSHPNYSDVDRVFSKMQFPSDWQEIDSSENRGIAGRTCPIESESVCFHKGKNFKVPVSANPEDVEKILLQTGCPTVAISDTTFKGEEKESKNLNCSIEALEVGSTYKGPESEVYVSVRTP